MRFIIAIGIFFHVYHSYSQNQDSQLLKTILFSSKDSLFNHVLKYPDSFRYQIIYTEINRDQNNKPHFRNHYLNVNEKLYFNPASTVKLPLAILSLEKLHQLGKYGISRNTSMQFDSSYSGQTKLTSDSTSETGYPSIAHFIKKAFLVSDNDAYNRMYEFVGQQQINRRLHQMGYPDIRITRRFMRMNQEENRHTNQIRFVDSTGKLMYTQDAQYNTDEFDFSNIHKLGIGYINSADELVKEPMDFTFANNLPISDLQQILQSVMFPSSLPKKKRFNLSEEDYDFLRRYLSQYPSETEYPKYDTSQYYDSYVKYFFIGNKSMPDSVRVFNKVGWAYGTLTDVSYVIDLKHHIEYMLSCTIYVNRDGILNDDRYEYETVGLPFLYLLGQQIYSYELKRERMIKPNLQKFQFIYHKRKEDGRPALKSIDN